MIAAILAALQWGSLLGGLAAWFQRKQEMERAKIEHAQRLELLRLEQAGALDAAKWAAFTASQNAAAAEDSSGVWKWAKSLRFATRFLLTWLVILSAIVVAFLPEPGPMAPKLMALADLAFGWWFGTRSALSAK